MEMRNWIYSSAFFGLLRLKRQSNSTLHYFYFFLFNEARAMAAGGLFWPSSSPSSLTRANAMQRTCDHAHENRGNETHTTICVAYSVHTLTTRANSRQEGHIGPLVSRSTHSHPTLSSPACSYMQNRDRATANAIARASPALALLVESMPNFMSAIGSTAPAGAGQR